MERKIVRFFWVAAIVIFILVIGGKVLQGFLSNHSRAVFLPNPKLFDQTLSELVVEKSGEKIVFTKKGDTWALSAPENYPADGSQVQQVIDSLKSASLEDHLSSRKEKFKDFGLEGEEVIAFSAKDGTGRMLLHGFLGKQMVGQWDSVYYRGDGSDDIYVLKGLNRYLFERNSKDFRSKLILEAPKDKISKVELVYSKGSPVLLVRDGVSWKMGSKAAKEEKVNEILGAIQRLEANDFAPTLELAQGAKKLGFEPKAKTMTVKISLSDGKVFELLIGDKKDSFYYAKLKDQPAVWKLVEWKVKPLLPTS